MGRKVYIDNKPLEEAKALLFRRLEEAGFFKLQAEEIDVVDSLGRITAVAVAARMSSPHYSASAMDGIAVRARDTFGASETTPIRLKRGEQFVEVDTGDYVPREFDAVIMIEDVNFPNPDMAEIIAPAVPWQHVRPVGEDVIASQMIVPALYPIRPYEIGALLTSGVRTISVVKRPVVGIIPTGTELVEPGVVDMAPGEIMESNSQMLAGMCREWGAVPHRFPIVIDDEELIKQAVIKCSQEADIIVVCSGSSAGREDYTAKIIGELGEVLLHGLAIRPGKPAILGIIDNKPVIGVPGYPVSAALVFELIAQPIIYRKRGAQKHEAEKMPARVSRKLASHVGVDEFVQVNLGHVGNDFIAYPLSRGAGITTSLVRSDGVIQVPRGTEGFEAGEMAQVELNRAPEIIARTLVAIGSHDLALDWLGNILNLKHGIRLSSANVGSMGGLVALKRRETHMAGIHLLDTDTGEYNISYINRYLSGERVRLVNLVKRQQGLLVKKGNPLGIGGIQDLIREEVRYINRQKGAGTRILLDYLLKAADIDTDDISGYEREEFTHLAVAAAIQSDTADAGLGIYAAARALGLDFIPVAEERYDLCFLLDLIDDTAFAAVMEAIASEDFRREVEHFGGYDLSLSGQVMWESD